MRNLRWDSLFAIKCIFISWKGCVVFVNLLPRVDISRMGRFCVFECSHLVKLSRITVTVTLPDSVKCKLMRLAIQAGWNASLNDSTFSVLACLMKKQMCLRSTMPTEKTQIFSSSSRNAYHTAARGSCNLNSWHWYIKVCLPYFVQTYSPTWFDADSSFLQYMLVLHNVKYKFYAWRRL